jgi:hypothetical protein
MTKQEAKELSLEAWEYLASYPEINDKRYLPNELWKLVQCLPFSCPLCNIFWGAVIDVHYRTVIVVHPPMSDGAILSRLKKGNKRRLR